MLKENIIDKESKTSGEHANQSRPLTTYRKEKEKTSSKKYDNTNIPSIEDTEMFSHYFVPLSQIDIDTELKLFTEQTVDLLKHVFSNSNINCCIDFICELLQHCFLKYTGGDKAKAHFQMAILYTHLHFMNNEVESLSNEAEAPFIGGNKHGHSNKI